jgi:hypothetical protein
MKGLLLVLFVLLAATLPIVRQRRPAPRRIALQCHDFKDRRDSRQRQSYGSIAAARQDLTDRRLLEEWQRRVRQNECNRIAKKLVGVPPVSAREG